MNEFDKKAAEWDKNPMHWARSEAITKEILKLVPLKKEMTALEFGAGTGINSFMLKDYLKEITLMDNSSEMIRMIDGKITTTGAKNLKALNFDLEHSDYKGGKFDFIFTQMVLHHIADIENLISKFQKLLNAGGYLAIADLYKEDGSFHGEKLTGHRGFDPLILTGILKKKKFVVTSFNKCFTINKETTDGEIKQFDVFLLIANH